MNITSGITGSTTAGNSGESDECRSLLSLAVQEGCGGDVGPIIVTLENTVSTSSSGVHGTLGYTLVVEMGDLLTQDEVLEKGRPSPACLQTVLIVDWTANIRGQKSVIVCADGELIQKLFGSDGASLIRDLSLLRLMSKRALSSEGQAGGGEEEQRS